MVIQSVDVCEYLHSVGLTHNPGGRINTTYHLLDFDYDHGDYNHTRQSRSIAYALSLSHESQSLR
jgi:hypothetical protein